MTIVLNPDGSLTEAQKIGAETIGISEEEMLRRLKRIQNLDKYDVSIIIPVYNGEKYIKEAIDSALNQTWKSVEVIVVNDGSTDGTHKICNSYDGITYYMKNNGGTGSALNTGIKFAQGEWIKWLSADDVLYPYSIERFMTWPKLDKNMIYYTHYDYIDMYGEQTAKFHEPDRSNKTTNDLKTEMLGNFFGNGSTSLIHKDIFKKIGMFDTLPHSEDYDFWLKALSNGVRMELCPFYSIRYRQHPDQLTHKVGGSLNDMIRSKYV